MTEPRTGLLATLTVVSILLVLPALLPAASAFAFDDPSAVASAWVVAGTFPAFCRSSSLAPAACHRCSAPENDTLVL